MEIMIYSRRGKVGPYGNPPKNMKTMLQNTHTHTFVWPLNGTNKQLEAAVCVLTTRWFLSQVNENDRLWGDEGDSTLPSGGLSDGGAEPPRLSLTLGLGWLLLLLLLLGQ